MFSFAYTEVTSSVKGIPYIAFQGSEDGLLHTGLIFQLLLMMVIALNEQ